MAAESDALVSWGERIGKLLLWILGPSTVSAIALGALGWITTYSFLYAALFALAAFALTQLGFTLWAIRRPSAKREPPAESEPQNTAGQHLAPADSSPQQSVDWQPLWFGIPTTKDARERLLTLLAESGQSASLDSIAELLEHDEQLRTRLRAERDEARVERDKANVERDVLKEKLNELRQASARQESLPSDEKLKQHSLRLSERLFRFSEERAKEAPQTGVFSKEKRDHDEETRRRYSRMFSGEVAALLDALERRGWCSPEKRKKLESYMKTVDVRVRLAAEYLAAIGQRL